MAQWAVSERTIKYDLSQLREALKEHGVKLLNKKGIGYYFSPDDKPKLIAAYSFSDVENSEEETRRDDCSFFFYKKKKPMVGGAILGAIIVGGIYLLMGGTLPEAI